MNDASPVLGDMNARSRAIFRQLVETYLETGEPVGSRTLSKQMGLQLSAASIRNVMQDLEALGVLDSPHASAGRIPTHLGLRLFVDGLLEIGDISDTERGAIDQAVGGAEGGIAQVLDEAGAMLSGLSQCASLVFAPKAEAPIRHIEFVSLAPDRAIAVLVTEDGQVENRLFQPPAGMTPSAMREAANFLNAALQGRTLAEAGAVMQRLPQRLVSVRVQRKADLPAATAVWDAVRACEDELGDDGRVVLRASGTEPLVRVMVEAPTEERCEHWCAEIAALALRELGDAGAGTH
jgi:heat-inducible transcriptional repressor